MKNLFGENFNIAHLEPSSQIYGEGQRYVVWFQGCTLACKGCWNQEMWSFKANQLIHRETLLDRILNTSEIQGVTFLGGEPLNQAENLWWLVKKIHEHSELTIFLFTGYEKEELESLGHMERINQFCDTVAIGRYNEEQRNINQQWIGSDNQTILTPKKSREKSQQKPINQVEVYINTDGSQTILGFPVKDREN